MQYAEVSKDLLNFINTLIGVNDQFRVDEATPLVESGIIGSLQTLKLVIYIKKKFNCYIPDEHINATTFKDINTITKLVLSLSMESV